MTLFRLDASIREDGSHSRAVADLVETEWRSANPAAAILRRHIGIEPIPAHAWGAAVSAAATLAADRTPEQHAAVALAAREADALVQSDAALFAVPLYNFGVSQHFKAWADLVITDPRMAPAAIPATAGKPAVLVTVRGGAYGAGTPREGWDHATGWMRRILEDVWQYDLKVVEREFTLVGVNPALDEFADLADQMRADAEKIAREHGRSLGAARVAA